MSKGMYTLFCQAERVIFCVLVIFYVLGGEKGRFVYAAVYIVYMVMYSVHDVHSRVHGLFFNSRVKNYVFRR